MGKFDLLRFKYLTKIGKDERFVELLTENIANDNQKVASEIALDPKNERELAIGEALYLYYKAMITLYEGMAYNDKEDIPLEDNYGIRTYIDLIKKVRDKKNSPNALISNMSPADRARSDYSFALANHQDSDVVCLYIGEQIGENFSFFHAVDDFNKIVRKLGIVNESPIDEELDINNEEQVKFFLEYAKAFNELVKNGKKHHNAERAKLTQNLFNVGRR